MKLRCRKCGRVLYDERQQKIDRPVACTVCGGVMAIENSDSEADLGIHPMLAKKNSTQNDRKDACGEHACA